MGNYQGYEKYKNSGVEWLGDIPEDWEVKKTKFLVTKIGSGKTPKGGSEVYIESGVMLIRSQNVYDDGFRLDDVVYIDDEIDNIQANSRVLKNDILLNITGASIGRVSLVPPGFGKANVNQHVCILRPNTEKIFPQYLYLLLCSQQGKEQIFSYENGTSREGLNFQQAGNLTFAIPPLDEQQKIAQFLDYKTKQIDKLIAKKEALLEKLNEKRTALISHAVTKGLDPTIPMKDSGIEWLGKIPQHWEAIRLKHITKQIIDGAHFTPTYVDEGIPFLRVTDIVQAKNNAINMNNIKFIPEEEHNILSIRCKPERGDLLYSKNGTIGVSRIVDWDFDFSIFVSLCLIKVIKQKVMVEFLQYSLLGKLTETQINIGAKSNTVTNLHLEKIKEFWSPIPPINEQKKIVEYLDQKTAEIDQQKAKIQKAIELLKEYRTALITNAVTGKIDIRQIPIP